MDAINEFDGIDFGVNPLVIIVAVIIVLMIFASRRGWGWRPVWMLLGLIGIMVIVGVLTGLAIIPDGVDIFTVLIGSLVLIGTYIYLITHPHRR